MILNRTVRRVFVANSRRKTSKNTAPLVLGADLSTHRQVGKLGKKKQTVDGCEFLHQLKTVVYPCLSHYLQGFNHPFDCLSDFATTQRIKAPSLIHPRRHRRHISCPIEIIIKVRPSLETKKWSWGSPILRGKKVPSYKLVYNFL